MCQVNDHRRSVLVDGVLFAYLANGLADDQRCALCCWLFVDIANIPSDSHLIRVRKEGKAWANANVTGNGGADAIPNDDLPRSVVGIPTIFRHAALRGISTHFAPLL